MDKTAIIALLENEIQTFEELNNIGQRYVNDIEEGYIEGLLKAIEIIDEQF